MIDENVAESFVLIVLIIVCGLLISQRGTNQHKIEIMQIDRNCITKEQK